MTFYNKIRWVLGITIVFILIVTTNLIDRNSFLRVKDSVASIYKDRLLAKDLIFDISKLIHTKEIAALTSDSTFFKQYNKEINSVLQDLISSFESTELTNKEEKVLAEFKNNVQKLRTLELAFAQNEWKEPQALKGQIALVQEDLENLSTIQIEEGKRDLAISQQAIDVVELFTHLEIYMLIIMAVLIQIILLYQPKQKEEKSET